MDHTKPFDEEFYAACVENIDSDTYSRVASFLLAQSLVEFDTPLDTTLRLARFFETGEI